ncbi:MAG TPA: hypothetical protein VGK94_12670 [Candidatus Polarisedimenticolia bacterium]|jgi:hypothetical protein
MRRLKLMSAVSVCLLMIGCGGQAPVQQADSTQPPAATTPSPAPAQPAAPAQQPPARQQPQQSAPRPSAASAPAPTPAPAKPQVHMVDVPSGTVLTLALDAGINTKKNVVGDAFTATLVEAIQVDGRDVIPAGSLVHGKVTEAVPAKRGAGNAKLGLSFDELTLPGGYRTAISGTFQEVSESKKKRNAAIIGGSAAGGALLGRILGKDTKTAVIGTIVGGGIGTAVVMGKEGEQAKLPADTPFEIKLEEPIQVPHEPQRS